MSEFKVPKTQSSGKKWKKPNFFQKGYWLTALPRDHPYHLCEQEWLKLTLRERVGGLAKGMAEHIIPSPTVSASNRPVPRTLSIIDELFGWGPTDEQLAEMERGFANREAINIMDSQIWKEQCGWVYDSNSPHWEKP